MPKCPLRSLDSSLTGVHMFSLIDVFAQYMIYDRASNLILNMYVSLSSIHFLKLHLIEYYV